MKYLLQFLKISLVLIGFSYLQLNAQQLNQYELLLKAEKQTPPVTTDFKQAIEPTYSERNAVKIYRLVQFYEIPSNEVKKDLKDAGVELISYIPNHAFFCKISNETLAEDLVNFKIRSIITIKPAYKIAQELKKAKLPEWALVDKDDIQLKVKYFLEEDKESLSAYIKNNNGSVLKTQDEINLLYLQYPANSITSLAQNNNVLWIEPISKPDEKDDAEGRSLHRSNAINTENSLGRKYDGTGVVIAIADDGPIGPHIDYQGRLTQHATGSGGSHGDMTAGIMYGCGNVNPKIKGMATGAYMHYYDIGGYPHVIDGVNNMNTFGTVVTSTSYSQTSGGVYTTDTEFIDQQISQNVNIIHVFSAGNAGTSDHGYGAGPGWANITGGYKAGKNIITSGNLDNKDALENSSSRGPADDGRIKPDLCANGIGQMSTAENNAYQVGGGTSAAAPGIAGVVAQLYHAYKDANAGANPPSGLIKAALLNTAEDLGNPGPDFKHGWGRINALKAVRIIEENRCLFNIVSQGTMNAHNIIVPANVSQVRIMTYWMDVEGSPIASKALVNDINMEVVDPGSTTFNPWVLDPTPNATSLDLDAVRGIDDLNNMEQVTIDNPAAGNYTVNVTGFSIPQGPQKYFVLYEFIYDEVEVTYPIGGEGFDPGTVEIIRWDALGNTGTFLLEYSVDNGGSWNTISASVAGNLRYYDWTVPTALTGQALVKVTRGANVNTSNQVFSIIGTPINLTIDWICPDSLQLSWDLVTGATAYEVSRLGVKYMDSVDVATTNSYVFNGVNPTQVDWFSVRALGATNARSERAIALEKPLGTTNCPIAIDVSVADLNPVNNAFFLDCMVGGSIDVNVSIKNEGLTVLSNVPVHYQLNSGVIINEVYVPSINPGVTVNHVFSTPITPVMGPNTLLVWSDIAGDGNFYNDSILSQFNFDNAPPKTIPWSEDFESFALCGTSSNCQSEICTLGNDFRNESNLSIDDIDWRTDEDGTPSFGTGPSVDFNPGTTSGNYIYLEASAGCNGMQANLISPCIDLSNITTAQLTFAYHMTGQDMGDLHLDIFMNGVWTDDIITPIIGDQGTSCNQQTVALTSYLGNVVNFRFRGVIND